MARYLTTDDVKTIYELVSKLSPEWTDIFAVDDSEGAEKPKKLSIAQLKALFTPYNGAENDVDLGDKIIKARKGLFENIVNNLTTTDEGYIADARQLKALKDLVDELKGVGWTDETLASLGLRLTTLEGTGSGSVQEQIEVAIDDLAGAGRTTETVKGNADDIAGIAGAGRTAETVKQNADDIGSLGNRLDSHKQALMPHIFEDLSTGKRYRYGRRISADGFPQKIYEEVL